MKRICLVGTGVKSRADAPYDDPTVEIWTIGRGRDIPPRVDRLFEIHVEALWDGYGDREAKQLYHDALKDWDKCPIVMQEHYPDIPRSVPFPKEEVLATVTPVYAGAELPYQTSQVSWQMSLAIHECFEAEKTAQMYMDRARGQTPEAYAEILLFGYDLISEGESRSYQRHAVEYYVALARGMGIKVTIAEQSTLCKHLREGHCVLYGYDYPLTRDEAVYVYGHPMRQILQDKNGNPVEIRSVPGVMGMPFLGEQGAELKIVQAGGPPIPSAPIQEHPSNGKSQD